MPINLIIFHKGESTMSGSIFRKKSIERLSSPEELNDYLQVTRPSVWAVLITVILLLAALFIWSFFVSVESYAAGTASVKNGVITMTFDNEKTAEKVETGMSVTIGEANAVITSVGNNDSGKIIAVANANIPDGVYSAKVGYKFTQIIDILVN